MITKCPWNPMISYFGKVVSQDFLGVVVLDMCAEFSEHYISIIIVCVCLLAEVYIP